MGNGAMAKGPQATAPILDSTIAVPRRMSRLRCTIRICSGCDCHFPTAVLPAEDADSDFPLLMWPPNRGAVLDTSLGANGALLG